MSMADLVRKARSVRRFDQSRVVRSDELLSLVDIVRVAPCGGNLQKLRYRIVSDQDECRRIFPFISWAGALKDWDGPVEGERPTGYLAIVSEDNPATDVGIAGAVIQLAAAEKGLGSCMLGAIKRDEIRSELHLPEEMNILLLVALGVPAEEVTLEEVSAGDHLSYYRTDDGIHHVPKLRLNDVVVATVE